MEYSVSILGSAGCGKTTYITRIKTGEFVKDHIPTTSSVSQITFHTNYGVAVINVTEYGGSFVCDKIKSDVIVMNIDGVIVMYDANEPNLTEPEYYMYASHPKAPIAVVRNKMDKLVNSKSIRPVVALAENFSRFEISSKSNFNFEKPWLWLLQKMSGHTDLKLINAPAIAPPDFA